MRAESPAVAARVGLRRKLIGASIALLLFTGCDPDDVPSAGGADHTRVVSGRERLAWSQEAHTAADLARFRFAAYVDGQRVGLEGATCSSERDLAGYSCSAPLPALSPGRHVIQLATAQDLDGTLAESPRSAAIVVVMIGGRGRRPASPGSALDRTFTSEGLAYRVQVVAENVDRPAALAITPDRRLWVAERSGTIKIFEQGQRSPHVALTPDDLRDAGDVMVHGLVAHPLFARNRQIFLLYTIVSDAGAVMRLTRLREINNVLGEPAVLLDGVPSSALQPAGALAFGRDHMLYVATGADASGNAEDAAALTGKVLRLKEDGTAADNGIPGSPVFVTGIEQPVAIDWSMPGGRLWIVERTRSSASATGIVRGDRANVLRRLDASAARVYRGSAVRAFRNDLFIAVGEGQHLERLRFDAANQAWITRDVLLSGWFGRLETVTEGPDGALYVGSGNGASAGVGADVVIRIVPARSR